MMEAANIVIVTGISGSGKSTALRAFEDRGYFSVDNIPATLLYDLASNLMKADPPRNHIAVGMDIRERVAGKQSYLTIVERLRREGHRVQVLFLEASQQVLIRRFSESRRPHPLITEGGDIQWALTREHKELSELRNLSTHVVDTSAMTVHELKQTIFDIVNATKGDHKQVINVVSFGFKYGVPLEADLMFDVRFLPNPYFVKELKEKSGLDEEVYDYVMANPDSRAFLEKMKDLMLFTLPHYRAEGKAYLTVAIGCTGGKHRSVALARALAAGLNVETSYIHLRHRDTGKE